MGAPRALRRGGRGGSLALPAAEGRRLSPAGEPGAGERAAGERAAGDVAPAGSAGAREPVFVGRRAELAALRAELSRASAGRHRLVVVEGEGGIGKTSLVHQVVSQLPSGPPAEASGAEAETGLAWGVVNQLLAGIAPAGRAPGTSRRPPAPGADPLAVGAGLVRRMADAAAGGLCVVVLDDLHWCDPVSASALLFALRRLDAVPLLTVVVVRPPFPGVLGEGWRRLASAKGRRLRLGGLDAGELAELGSGLGRPVSGRAAERLRAHTGGHPLWAVAVLQELAQGELERGEGALPVPGDLAGTIRARHGSLSGPAQAMVAAGAVLGEQFAAVTGAALAQLEDPAPALQEAAEAGLLSEVPLQAGSPALVRFQHPLVRAAVYRDIGAGARSRLHAEAARLTSGPAALAHLVAATVGPSEAVAAELESAGTSELERDEGSLAQFHLDSAARLSPPGPDRRRRVLAAMEAHLRAGEPARARAYADEAEAQPACPARDYVLGCLWRSEGLFAAAQERLLAAWRSLGGEGAASLGGDGGSRAGDSELAAKVAVELAALAVLRMSGCEAAGFALVASEAARVPSTAHLALCVRMVGMALGGRGAEALSLAGAAPARATELHELVGRGIVKLWTDDLMGAHEDLSVAVLRAQAGEALRLLVPRAFLADACFRLGRMTEAASHAELACDIVDAAGRDWDCAIVHTRAGYAAAALGDFPGAEAHASAIGRLARRMGRAAGVGGDELARVRASATIAAGVAAALALARDDAAGLLVAAEAVSALSGPSEPGTFALGPVLAEALASLGRLAEAQEALAAYEARAVAVGRRSARAGAARVRGSICAASGDLPAARRSFEEALRLARGLPFEIGRCHHAYGRALAAGDDPRGARAQLAAARVSFAGAGAFLRVVEADLAALGPLPPSAADALTPAERAVAHLAAARLTNPEIADRLSVSRKTVEFHLSHVYAKLGVRSRTELARLAGESDGAGSPGGG